MFLPFNSGLGITINLFRDIAYAPLGRLRSTVYAYRYLIARLTDNIYEY